MRFEMKFQRSESTNRVFLKFSWSRGFLFLMIMISCVFLAILSMTTVYSSDDYWYSTFMDDGVSEYLNLMKEHYLTFNGRVFVHFIAQLILHSGNILFTVFTITLFTLIPIAAAGMDRRTTADDIAITVLVFLIGILALPRAVMVNGVLWISGFCNYALSAAMIL